MSLTSRSRSIRFALGLGACLSLALAGTAQAHIVKIFGTYTVALGWKVEPTYVGAINAVQAIVTDAKGNAVTDIPDGDLTVVVSVAGTQPSSALPLDNAFDSDTGLGIPGDYEASIVPTVPGDYTFHLNGKIHGVAVDETATASESTFDPVVDSSSVDFPTKLPSIADIVTRLNQIDARASSAPSTSAAPAPSGGADALSVAQDAQAAAASAESSASTALQIGVLVGAIGILIGGAALILVMRRRPGSA